MKRQVAAEQPASVAYEFSFGPFRLLSAERILSEGDRPVRLGSRALDILIALVVRAGELVSKRDLVAIVWPETVVVEANLTVHVAALRRALGDGQGGQRYIVNIPGRGYRFVAPVSIVTQSVPAAPPAAAPQAPHNLPAQLTRLIGRDDVVRNLCQRIAAHRLLTVVGAGGVGKTAVALDVAEQMIGTLKDGVWLVDLAPVTDPELVPTALAASLKLEIRSDNPLPSLIGALSDKQMLLVLDNCEHVIDQAAALAAGITKAARNVHVLATSREPLHVDGEQLYRLPPLETPPDMATLTATEALGFPAVQLFVERAAAASNEFDLTDADARSVASICRKLDGLPLAIEFAAARVDTFGVRGLASRLDDRLSVLGGGPRGQIRHQTIGATLDWSYHLLSAAEQATFRRLAIFIGGFTINSASAVLGGIAGDGEDITESIAGLVMKSLIVAGISDGDARFRFLATTRAYAIEKLRESGEAEPLARRHAEHFRDFLEAAQSDPTGRRSIAAEVAKPEIDNIRAALVWGFGPHGDRETAVALAAASAPIWLNISLLTECHAWTGKALALLDDADRGSRREMVLQTEFGMSLMHALGVSEPARAALTRGSELAERLGDIGWHLRAISGLTNLCLRLEDFHGALALAREAEAVVAGSSNPVELATAEFLFSGSLVYVGEYAQAMAYAQRAFARIRALPQQAAVVRSGLDHGIQARCVVANILWIQGLVDQAARMTKQIIVDAEAGGHALSLCFALAWCGCAFPLRLGDMPGAEHAVRLLGDWADRHDLPSYKACTLTYHGALLAKRGDFADAEAKLRAGLAGLSEAQFEVQFTPFLSSHADVLARTGRREEALLLAEEALARCRHNDVQWWMPEALRIKGEIFLLGEQPDMGAAEALFVQSLELSQLHGALFWELRGALSLAELRKGQGKTDDARKLLDASYGKFTEGFSTADLMRARTLLDQWATA
ncbi:MULTISPECIES: ATP-binding protein [Bradyrhizobium]|uniref:ATP-binding protein n=1 Tax=Bradyrhizobium elkanii TaxID=29448 RepID=UPI0018AD47F1|nr:winged helix-turn-helix domain-containing protein [Bradyrhizobium elkanii]